MKYKVNLARPNFAGLNLATKPFRNRRLPWFISALLIAVSLVSLLLMLRAVRNEEIKQQLIRADLAALKPEVEKYRAQAETLKGSITTDQAMVLREAHRISAFKRFSWSRLFYDVENVLPRGVGVSNISVNDVYVRNEKTYADLSFSVLSLNYQSVIDMIANMNSSGVFQAELRQQDLQKGKGDVSEYTLRVLYNTSSGLPSEAAVAANFDR